MKCFESAPIHTSLTRSASCGLRNRPTGPKQTMEPSTLVRRIPGQLCGCPIDSLHMLTWFRRWLSSHRHCKAEHRHRQYKLLMAILFLVIRYWQSTTISFKCCVRVNTVKSNYNSNYASCHRLSFFARTSCTWYRIHRAGWLLRMTYQELAWTWNLCLFVWALRQYFYAADWRTSRY